MKTTSRCVVALTWKLHDTLGELLDELDEPAEFLIGGGDLLAPIDAALQGLEPGAQLELQIEPEQAFGEYDEKLVFLEARPLFPTELEEGMVFEGLPPGCSPDAPKDRMFHVTDIYPEHVVLDGNHPLAGIALRLKLSLRSVRTASEEESDRGTVGASLFRLCP